MKDYMTPAEVAKACDVAEITVRRWRKKETGPPYYKTPGGHVRYPRAEFNTWVAESMKAAA